MYLSYIDLIMLSRTCKRFFVLVNQVTRFKTINKNFQEVFDSPMENSFIEKFIIYIERFFNCHYPGYYNKLYCKWVLSYFKEQLNARFLFGDFFWCRRNTNNKYSCKFCIPVEICLKLDYSEFNTTGVYSLNSYGRWNEKFIKIFQNNEYYSKDLNSIYRQCPPKDVIYCYNQLLNYFAKISVRVYMNLGKKYFFLGKYKQKFFYERYMDQTRHLFSSIALNVSKAYIQKAVKYLEPVRHYDPSYLIISNIPYIQYLKRKQYAYADISDYII